MVKLYGGRSLLFSFLYNTSTSFFSELLIKISPILLKNTYLVHKLAAKMALHVVFKPLFELIKSYEQFVQ